MNDERIKIAEELALEFLVLIRQRREAIEKSVFDLNGLRYHSDCPRESGALRRKSLDLTRALAQMRKP